MFIVSLLWLLMVSTPFVPNLLIENLETRYEVVSTETIKNSNKPVNILILGAGYSTDSRFPATNKLSENTLTRLVEGIRIHNNIQGSYLITSGSKGKEDVSQAEILSEAAVLLGVESSQIRMQEEPINTWSEATECKRLFGDTAQLVIVTSAIHMPRAMYLFQKAGLDPIAAPTGHLIKKGKKRNFWFWIPVSDNIKKMEAAIHEYVGMLWYKLGGS